ncbi:hypothetical protein [Actinomycetospora sp. NBRC 106378]|uniref:hypothetical protein n=1 Tax=Actinomycetospora sp. NBRC 106378 TaxID=3032208 RepID=UPI0024A184C3|nr:hypothetical protein [Actinomycetospora sp. NBRC 106378]GLZ54233.1 hypothetical protein Acsp07_38500 [Actinomycetospora sp. NBRC 106378]
MIRNGQQHASWRRGREVLDDYDLDRVLTEELADDLVNELACLRPRRRPARAVGATLPVPVPARRPHLQVIRGGLAD